MDIQIKDGDWVHSGGRLETVSGREEAAQHAALRLSAKRGRFYGNQNLGSFLYTLTQTEEPQRSILAMQYARQALEDMNGVWPQRVVWEDGAPAFILSVQGEDMEVRVRL